jgi:hypothetical protein
METSDNRDLLMTYTVFHIGVYITLAAAILAAQELRSTLNHPVMRFSMMGFVIAGICGAVIASNLPESADWKDFVSKRIGPWGLRLAKYGLWATVEHLAFWLGVLVPVGVALFSPGTLAK